MRPAERLFLVFNAHQIKKLKDSAKNAGSEFHALERFQMLASGVAATSRIHTALAVANSPLIMSLLLRHPRSLADAKRICQDEAKDFFQDHAFEESSVLIDEDTNQIRMYYSSKIISPQEATAYLRARIGTHPESAPTSGPARTETYHVGNTPGGSNKK